MSNIETKEEYKKYKQELHQQMLQKQQVPYWYLDAKGDVLKGQLSIFDYMKGETDG